MAIGTADPVPQYVFENWLNFLEVDGFYHRHCDTDWYKIDHHLLKSRWQSSDNLPVTTIICVPNLVMLPILSKKWRKKNQSKQIVAAFTYLSKWHSS
jgi:hypothetical protein